ncbi:MAG TPA: PEP-CTERM sorting domain-containing protein [Roseiarcus sp.]
MTLARKVLIGSIAFAALGASAQAGSVASSSVFATGGPVGGTGPDSVTVGDGSVWIEYGNGADSTGAAGSSTIVQYSPGGAVQHTYQISGLVDGLKFNPVTGKVWALQNNDGNATLSIINPTAHTVSGPLSYAAPPYAYGPNGGSGRGYDDVAFLGGKVYLSYTNPSSPTDPVLQILNNGNSPTGTLTTTTILTASQTGITTPDIDSLKSTPGGELVLTSEGDGPTTANPVGTFTLISNPGTTSQTVTNVPVTDASGRPSEGMDDVLFPGVTQGTLFVSDTPTNKVYEVRLTGLDPNTPIISLGTFGEVATVNPLTGVVETPLLTGLTAPHGLDFIPFAVPEPSTWALLPLGFAGLGYAGYRRSREARAT